MKQRNIKEDFLSMLLGTLGVPLLGNLLTGNEFERAAEGTIRAYSKDNLRKIIKNRAYVINLYEYADVGKH